MSEKGSAPMDNYYEVGVMRRLLTEGARIDGVLNVQAAMYLLTFTEIPAYRRFQARHVTEGDHYSFVDRGPQHGAWIQSWPDLLRDRELRLTGTERTMLRLSASLAYGTSVKLDQLLTRGLGWAHTKRLAEAVFICTGCQALLKVNDGPELPKLQELYQELSGGDPCG